MRLFQYILGLLQSGVVMAKRGLYANIHAKRKSGKKMRKKGEKGAPSDADFAKAKLTAKKPKKKKKSKK